MKKKAEAIIEKDIYEAYLDRITMPTKPRKLTKEEIEQLKVRRNLERGVTKTLDHYKLT